MAFYLNNNLFFDIYLNNVPLSVTYSNILDLNIVSSIFCSLPCLRMRILDTTNAFRNGNLNDGSTFVIKIGNTQDSASDKSYTFRLQGVPTSTDSGSGKVYLIYGILDKLKFQKSTDPIFCDGTSSQAIAKVCSASDLQFSGTITNDEMIWMNGTKDYSSFVQQIVNHGYVDSTSCMVGGVSLEGTYIYRNVNSVEGKYTFTNTVTDDPLSYFFIQNQQEDLSGLYNLEYGYKNSIAQFGLDTNFYQDSLTVTKFASSVLNLSKSQLDTIGLVKRKILPPDVGNFHSKWAQAEYQNIRQKALFSVEQPFIFDTKVPIDLLDKVYLSYVDRQTKQPDTSKATEWIVIGKTLAISNRKYYEKYTCRATGQNSSLFGNLV